MRGRSLPYPRRRDLSGLVSGPILARALDALLELAIVGSFSRIGFLARRSTQHWLNPPRLDGQVFIVTGGTSGIGAAISVALAKLGAEAWVVGRSQERADHVVELIRSAGGLGESAIADMAEGQSINEFATRFRSERTRLDGIVHNAGALLRNFSKSSEGVELTVATQVLGPFRLTELLAPLLWSASHPVIVSMSSGGMYTERFDLAHLEMEADQYDGVRAYARAKRAQVVMAREWARRWSRKGVASYSVHPGWVDTPGLASGLPSFERLGPLLRRPEEGADTAVWLAAGAARSEVTQNSVMGRSGLENGFWFDRRQRRENYLPWTRTSLPPDMEGEALWDWCCKRIGRSGHDRQISRR